MARVVRLPAEAFDQCRPDIADELRSTGDLDRVIAGGGEEVATRKLTHDQVVALLLHVRTMTDEVTLKEALLSLGLLHIGGEPPRTM
jgi:ribosomal protein L25 (general stress protein Ctc)